ncbi:hypothetical protein FGO68_gene16878 [Halteria grandinella]|uniref:G-patch domain-containing protein n=1 Tax=Halteria grandinella TaxID=5974 RepID=A0A8J8SYN2_HALGN|nr:hypothetical protein FGO68_gene16878 [Halteria grandinella]
MQVCVMFVYQIYQLLRNMSRKYFDKLMTGTGVSDKKVKSSLAETLMKKMGWSEGKGLGKHETGETEVLQIKRREEGQALGAANQTAAANFKWDNQFWIDAYNKSASKLAAIENKDKDKKRGKKKDNKKDKKKDSKKKKEVSEDEDSDDFELVIEKSTKSLLSKAISKDKPAPTSSSKSKKDGEKDGKKDKKREEVEAGQKLKRERSDSISTRLRSSSNV